VSDCSPAFHLRLEMQPDRFDPVSRGTAAGPTAYLAQPVEATAYTTRMTTARVRDGNVPPWCDAQSHQSCAECSATGPDRRSR
jgi:hypothetical protein